jgi:hypothetical protein
MNRHDRDTDSMEAIKPLVVLALFGTILYGAFSMVQKGPGPAAGSSELAEAPPFAAPEVHVPTPAALPDGFARPASGGGFAAPAVAVVPPVPAPVVVPAEPASAAPTYLTAESAPPPVAASVGLPPAGESARPDRFATLPSAPLVPADLPAPAAAPPREPAAPTAAFATAWSDAHDKLTSGRYAEALQALSVWYDDPSLGLEESHRLEDLLGQLAGTVIYSQQDLLLPPHVVGPGETLPAIAAPLGVSPQLLAKINGIVDPLRLTPGEHVKLIRGPFDAVVSVSRRRLSLQLAGAYAGSFPAVVGRQFLDRVGGSLPVVEVVLGDAAAVAPRRALILGDGLTIEAVEDPATVSDAVPPSSLVVSTRDLDELLDILGPGSRVLVRQ